MKVRCGGCETEFERRGYGKAGSIEWTQEHPNWLRHTPFGKAPLVISRGGPAAGVAAAQATRIPAGHPEGFLEAFAQIYRDAAALIRAQRDGVQPPPECALLPGVADGLRGLQFIAACVHSSAGGSRMTPIEAR